MLTDAVCQLEVTRSRELSACYHVLPGYDLRTITRRQKIPLIATGTLEVSGIHGVSQCIYRAEPGDIESVTGGLPAFCVAARARRVLHVMIERGQRRNQWAIFISPV